MTKASDGLRKAAARVSTGVALADLSADEVIAGISAETKLALTASLVSTADLSASDASDDMDEDDGEMPKKKGKDKAKPDGDMDESANASANARIKAVAASDVVKGREALALSMLADDDYASLSADAMIKLLGKQPVASGSDQNADAAAIINAIEGQNANVDGNGGQRAADANYGWGKATARVNSLSGFKA